MNKIIAVAGPTAVGKTKFAIDIARNFNGEIVSCDSMQLYKYMNIGSAKPTFEELSQAKHHLVDIIDPRDDFSVAQYQKLAKAAIADIIDRGKIPVISGGTGLYLNSLIYDMDFSNTPQDSAYRESLARIAEAKGSSELHKMLCQLDRNAAESIHPNNTKKIIRALERIHGGEKTVRPFREISREAKEYEVILIGLTRNREELYDRINKRVDKLMEMGLVDEVQTLMEMGLNEDNISMKGIGYKEIMDYLSGKCSLQTAIDTVKKNTRHYAKKQLTWYRRYDKIIWYNISDFVDDENAAGEITAWLRTKI